MEGYKLLTSEILSCLRRTNEVYVGFLALRNIELLKDEINELSKRNGEFLGIEPQRVRYNSNNGTLEEIKD
jgi:hypothetical protein